LQSLSDPRCPGDSFALRVRLPEHLRVRLRSTGTSASANAEDQYNADKKRVHGDDQSDQDSFWICLHKRHEVPEQQL
ncbi:unnamed protein product, partial [Amoebophrya sp. A25]